jgi:hypothetical protein
LKELPERWKRNSTDSQNAHPVGIWGFLYVSLSFVQTFPMSTDPNVNELSAFNSVSQPQTV